MLPNVVDESQVNQFCYWDEKICKGMMYQGELYRHLNSYEEQERINIFLLGMKLTQQGLTICITCADGIYSLWIGLRLENSAMAHSSNIQDSFSKTLDFHHYVNF